MHFSNLVAVVNPAIPVAGAVVAAVTTAWRWISKDRIARFVGDVTADFELAARLDAVGAPDAADIRRREALRYFEARLARSDINREHVGTVWAGMLAFYGYVLMFVPRLCGWRGTARGDLIVIIAGVFTWVCVMTWFILRLRQEKLVKARALLRLQRHVHEVGFALAPFSAAVRNEACENDTDWLAAQFPKGSFALGRWGRPEKVSRMGLLLPEQRQAQPSAREGSVAKQPS